jgi:hypothetical protein
MQCARSPLAVARSLSTPYPGRSVQYAGSRTDGAPQQTHARWGRRCWGQLESEPLRQAGLKQQKVSGCNARGGTASLAHRIVSARSTVSRTTTHGGCGRVVGQEELMREEDAHRATSSFDTSVARQRASEKFVVHRNPAFDQQQQGFATPNPLQAGTRGEGTSADALVVVNTPHTASRRRTP